MALDELKTQRKVIKYSITRHQTAVNAFKEGSNVVTLETRLSDLSELFKKYNAIQSDIESLQFKELSDRDDFDEAAWDAGNDKERTGVENQYYEVVAKIKTFLLKTDTCTGPGGSTTVININKSASDSNENVTNLKPLPLPVFSGKLSEWYNFYDSFKSLVHDDKTISDIRKFHYLRGCLKDEALRAIESLTISNDNYVTALELLIKRFENKRLIVNEHVLNILNITPLMKSSHVELRQLLDAVNNNIAALKVLELPVDQWDALLIPIITEKLDYATKREWQTVLNKEVPKYVDFNEFLEKRYQILEALTTIKPQISNNSKPTNTFKNNNNSNNNKYGNNRSFSNHLVYKPTCSFCKKGHSIYQCDDFLKRTVVERLNEISKLQMCENCLRTNHKAEQCKSKSLCKICREKHHTLLHINEFNPTQTSLYTVGPSQVLLSTVTVLIADRHGNFHKCRGLLDQGSQANILTSKMCKKLGLFTTKVATSLTGINSRAISINEGVKVTIKSLASDFASNINCLIVPKITEPTPSFSFPKQLIKVPTNVTPSDQDFNSPKDIDLLIGAGLYWDLLIGAAFQLEVNQPFWQNTKLGFEGDLELCLESLWLDEEIEGGTTLSGDHLRCETHFGENYARSSHGQFIVKFPFMENTQLGNSYDMALNRYLGLERKLGKNPSLKEAYVGFMNEYLNLGHMEPAAIKHLEGDNIYYLPHHAVFKNTISGPKIRVVFDASAPTSNGLSLNDISLTGPTLQQDLFSILCRFRTYKYVVSADITKMYRMILMHENDRDFQRILWRNEVSEPVQIYRLNTVTYGTTCAPFLAVRCLFQLALEAENDFPLASNIIKRDFYMDDLLSGSNSKEEALLIKGQVTKILKKGGFNLCKWTSNLDELSAEGDHSTAINLNKGDYKILGFHWNCTDDQLKYNVNIQQISEPFFRKRNKFSLYTSQITTFWGPLGESLCIEACLNSRPLTPLSPDPNDLNALTPGHLLIGAPLTNTAEEDVTPLPINRLSRWQRVQQLHQQFWKRWTQEYLSELQRRPKGQQSSTSQVAVGSLVVIIEDNLPPLKWKLGRVLQLHPGLDGVVRVVTVKTSTGVYKRTIKKVCLLPADAD
ncbi:uncharacterized protein LOC135136082 [Zophobas morio]|uniref:uncharacterized protein LOC135136082 n=1 Tax=Zophobas morio TaxID=2755281 RepID=UPI003082DADB